VYLLSGGSWPDMIACIGVAERRKLGAAAKPSWLAGPSPSALFGPPFAPFASYVRDVRQLSCPVSNGSRAMSHSSTIGATSRRTAIPVASEGAFVARVMT
jgi:hypothetical protein